MFRSANKRVVLMSPREDESDNIYQDQTILAAYAILSVGNIGMGKKYLLFVVSFVVATTALITTLILNRGSIALLNPEGKIAGHQYDLLMFAVGLSLIVIIPVFILAFYVLWKYNENNKKVQYTPLWDHNHRLELLWWGVPIVLVVILAVITFKSSHDLDPYKAIQSNKEPVTIQVIALEWKWLFIYPEQKIATVNHITIPENRPINFRITADAPMNSFWIPKLGGQVYAMSGMETKLHLMADKPGTYKGVAANLSGEGHAGMKFTVDSVSDGDFGTWINTVRQSPDFLDTKTYEELAKKSKNNPKAYYSQVQPTLYNDILNKYMPAKSEQEDNHKGH